MNSKILEKLAKIISIVFSPIINSSIAFFLLILTINNTTFLQKILLLCISILFSTVIPLLYVLYLKYSGRIKSLDLDERLKRINPLSIGIVSYFLGFILLVLMDAPRLAQGLMFCYASNTVVVLIITRWWKVSIHSTGISGPLVALTYKYGNIVIPFYILIALVGGSRIILKKHTIAQVIAGISIGLGLTAIQIYYLFL